MVLFILEVTTKLPSPLLSRKILRLFQLNKYTQSVFKGRVKKNMDLSIFGSF